MRSERLLQFAPGASHPQVREVRPDTIGECGLAGALGLPALPAREARGLRGLLPVELIEPARHLAEPELALELAQRPLNPRPVLPALPRHARLRVHPVHHDVHMGMRPVLVCNHQGLVVGQAQVPQDAVGHRLHLGGCDRIGWVEVDRQMVDGGLDPRVLIGGGLHEHRRELRVVEAQVSTRGPGHALGLFS